MTSQIILSPCIVTRVAGKYKEEIMPRTRLDRFSQKPETYRKAVKKCIQAAMIREDVPMFKSLAVDMDMNPRQLRDRINKSGFRDYELVKLDRILKFTDKERETIWGR